MNNNDSNKIHLDFHKITFIIIIMIFVFVPLITYTKITESYGIIYTEYFSCYKMIYLCVISSISIILIMIKAHKKMFSNYDFKINIPYLLFVIYISISVLFSIDTKTSFYGSPERYTGLITYLCFLFIYINIINNFDQTDIKNVVKVILLSSLPIATLSVLEFYDIDYIGNILPDYLGHGSKVHATFGNSNAVGSYFAIMAPLALITFIRSRTKLDNILFAFFSMTCILGLIVSASRISWLSVFFALMICIYAIEKNNYTSIKCIILIIYLMLVLFITNITSKNYIYNHIANAYNQYVNINDDNYQGFGSGRFKIYEKSINIAFSNTKNILVGVGLDCLMYNGIPSKNTNNINPELMLNEYDKAHSDFIEYLATTGLPSLILYVWFILTILLPYLINIKNTSPETNGIFAAWLGYVIQSMFNVHHIGTIAIFMTLTAILDNQLYQHSPIKSYKVNLKESARLGRNSQGGFKNCCRQRHASRPTF